MTRKNEIFNRITSLLEDIALEKQAQEAAAKNKSEMKPKRRDGEILQANDTLMREGYPPQLVTDNDDPAQPGLNPNSPGENLYTDTEPVSTRKIDATYVDISHYKSANLSDVNTIQLVKDAVAIGNSLLRDLLDRQYTTADQQQVNVKEAETDTPSDDSTFEQLVEKPMQESEQLKATSDAADLAAGVLYGLQKQAEYHADLVGKYLYGFLHDKLAKKAEELGLKEESSAAEGPPTPQENSDVVPESSEEDQETAKGESGKKNKKNKSTDEESEAATEEGADVDEEAELEESDKDASGDLTEEDAVKALKDMSSGPSTDEALQALSLAMEDLGIGLTDLQSLGGTGAKLASALASYRRSPNFKIGLNNPRVKEARAHVRKYIHDLYERSNRKL